MAKTSALCWSECRNLANAVKEDLQQEQGAGSSNTGAAVEEDSPNFVVVTEDIRFTWLGNALVASWGYKMLLVLLFFFGLLWLFPLDSLLL